MNKETKVAFVFLAAEIELLAYIGQYVGCFPAQLADAQDIPLVLIHFVG